jgi:N-acetylneuraminic acid mutarotase
VGRISLLVCQRCRALRVLAQGMVGVCALAFASCGGGGSNDTGPSGTATTYSVGGTIGGLGASGLVLANGADTLSPAVGATSFAFSGRLTSGTAYAVTVATQPAGANCTITGGSGVVAAANVTDVVVSCIGAWTWVSGSSTGNTSGTYGTLGVAASTNAPGGRSGSVSWADGSGNLWLFGGTGIDSTGVSGELNDLWEYSPNTDEWTWVGGSNTILAKGVYGVQGVAASTSVPGARHASASWIDGSGNLWLFGGFGYDSTGFGADDLNDLWRYSPVTREWTWIGGSHTAAAPGAYGSRGTASPANMPGARSGSSSWIDGSGNLWLFGGFGYDSTGSANILNDLWKYSPNTGQWTWVGGSSTGGAQGVYGSEGTASSSNVPGARAGSSSWVDGSGALWLFGGHGFDSTTNVALLNDLWTYVPTTDQWVWVGGSNSGNSKGIYGTEGKGDPANAPGGRWLSVSWFDRGGNLWLFGGYGYDAAGTLGCLDDLWEYTPSNGQWSWMSGSSVVNASGVYGTRGTASSANLPGARSGSISWLDSSGSLWLFGGNYADLVSSNQYSDLWKY